MRALELAWPQPAGPHPKGHCLATGHSGLDTIAFQHRPMAASLVHQASGIAVLEVTALAPGAAAALAEVRRGPTSWDTLTVTRGGNHWVEGLIGGQRLGLRPAGPRISFVPYGCEGWIAGPGHAASLSLLLPPGRLAAALPDKTVLAPRFFESDPRLIQLVKLIAEESRIPDFAADLLVDGLVRALADRLAQGAARRSERIHLTPARLRRVLDHIEAHLGEPLALAQLAMVAGLSAFHFSRVFKLATGLSPHAYVREQRLARARALLGNRGQSIAEVALICGFANQSHFTTAFSRAMGVSPARFRRLAQR